MAKSTKGCLLLFLQKQSVLGPLFRTAEHLVRTQHGVTASGGQRRGDVEVRSFLRDQAGSRSLVFDLKHYPRQVWVKQPRATERVPLASPGP
jgi:hypothetical protein